MNSPLYKQPETARAFLTEVYSCLGYTPSTLLDATPYPSSPATSEAWLEKGDWLALADKVGADKVLFVNNDPVIVFYEFHEEPSDNEILQVFRRVWCLARPSCLFIARPGLLQVYSLNQLPVKDVQEWKKISPLQVVRRVKDVAQKLRTYRREYIETGTLFAENYFGDINKRADKRLIGDLKKVHQVLIHTGLDKSFAHALIGRSIFIRYLEDRGILTPKYFEHVAGNNSNWLDILAQEPEKVDVTPHLKHRRYDRVLQDKDFTYALFDHLADKFNGDMFPRDSHERNAVDQQRHLEPLRKFLLGDVDHKQQKLFFWAYDFQIIPLELISNIYEEFYHEKTSTDDKGTHYTPGVLVAYTLSQILTRDCLAKNPRVLDPACGSGIFLVEAFRRIVRYRMQQQGGAISPHDLRDILQKQIAGIEINGEAVRVAAFSLYLALLHYQEPPDIIDKRLPNLVHTNNQTQDENHYHILFEADTFWLTEEEREQLRARLHAEKRFNGRSEMNNLYSSEGRLPVELHSFDVIVGNPPWGSKKQIVQQQASDVIEDNSYRGSEKQPVQQQASDWCEVFQWDIGDKELSQMFIARSLSLLKPGGKSGLLVSMGVFLKKHQKSKAFRNRWLQECSVETVTNFSHICKLFFDTNSPFAFVHYTLSKARPDHMVRYWSVKRSSNIDNTHLITLNSTDIHRVRQIELANNYYLWKVYWWGNHHDASLTNQLIYFNKVLNQVIDVKKSGRGFQGIRQREDNVPADWLKQFKELPVDCFQRYSPVKETDLIKVPDRVQRLGNSAIYTGWRLLIKRGITIKGLNGQILSRLENKSYCFRNSIHGINLDSATDWERKVLIGIFWSSVARYYFFMTSGSWLWHDEIHLEDVISMPIRFPDTIQLRERIITIVDTLREWEHPHNSLLDLDDLSNRKRDERDDKLKALERDLDEAIFDLYELSEAERDLIRDMCDVGLEFFYRHANSAAIRRIDYFPYPYQGTIVDLSAEREMQQGLDGYLYTFLQIWNRELEPDGEFCWRVIRAPDAPMIAVVFSTQQKKAPHLIRHADQTKDWLDVIEQFEHDLHQSVSPHIYLDGMVRGVTDTDIFIIKRDERRLWTRSMAREDAEAILVQAMYVQTASQEKGTSRLEQEIERTFPCSPFGLHHFWVDLRDCYF